MGVTAACRRAGRASAFVEQAEDHRAPLGDEDVVGAAQALVSMNSKPMRTRSGPQQLRLREALAAAGADDEDLRTELARDGQVLGLQSAEVARPRVAPSR